jgi:ATP-dependent RNA helicase RhlE
MSQNKRQRAIDGFRGNKYDILVATDVASRGIDVLDISHVINYDVPDTTDTYTHRIGRTGRADRTGEAFTFASSEDTQIVLDIDRTLGAPIERRTLQDFEYGKFVPEKQFQRKASKHKRPTSSNKKSRKRRRNRVRSKKARATAR